MAMDHEAGSASETGAPQPPQGRDAGSTPAGRPTRLAAGLRQEQGAATQEIARNVQEAAKGTQEVNANIAGVTTAAGETGTAASQMLAGAGELANQSETLRQEVDKFLADIKAA